MNITCAARNVHPWRACAYTPHLSHITTPHTSKYGADLDRVWHYTELVQYSGRTLIPYLRGRLRPSDERMLRSVKVKNGQLTPKWAKNWGCKLHPTFLNCEPGELRRVWPECYCYYCYQFPLNEDVYYDNNNNNNNNLRHNDCHLKSSAQAFPGHPRRKKFWLYRHCNLMYNMPLWRTKRISRKWKWMGHISFWNGLMMLTFKSLPDTLPSTRLKIKQFCMVITLYLCVLYGSQNK
jgi:hypothetical protein